MHHIIETPFLLHVRVVASAAGSVLFVYLHIVWQAATARRGEAVLTVSAMRPYIMHVQATNVSGRLPVFTSWCTAAYLAASDIQSRTSRRLAYRALRHATVTPESDRYSAILLLLTPTILPDMSWRVRRYLLVRCRTRPSAHISLQVRTVGLLRHLSNRVVISREWCLNTLREMHASRWLLNYAELLFAAVISYVMRNKRRSW